ncbi:MAG: type II toxin-antitoxin system VapC family toxin [Gemmataceae bacterium]|nr:type II toxin-antitoxin system VapC family toxin [Gemmataceae bacterium]
MCIIIDANVAHKFGQPPHDDVIPVVSWLLNRKHRNQAVIGGRLRKELRDAGQTIQRFLIRLARAGRLVDVPDEEVNAEEEVVRKLFEEEGIEGADDPHILALARVSGARLLISHDKSSRLHELFKDNRFVKGGKIYQKPSHKGLLWRAPKCKPQKE